MRGRVIRVAAHLGRVLSLMLLAAMGTITLMRFAPGYFTDGREMDGKYALGARAALQVQQDQQGSLGRLTRTRLNGWFHGDLGRSRQFDVPVTELIFPRIKVTARLLLSGVACGWIIAFGIALPLSARQAASGEVFIMTAAAILLAVPIGAMAALCLLTDTGGPLLVLTLLVGVRDFKFIYRLVRQTGSMPCLLHARAMGIASLRITWAHLLPTLKMELLALATTSIVFALSAIVPLEVVFDIPGLGQLAWSAAMNRDLPVLLAVTFLVAMCIGIVSSVAGPAQRSKVYACA